jgi:hypothetical protein
MTAAWSSTKSLTDETLLNKMNAVFNARSGEHRIKKRIKITVNKITGMIKDILGSQEHFRIQSAPSKAAMEGAIGLTGETHQAIHITRPSVDLVQKFSEIINLTGLKDLWYPSSLIAWSFGIISRHMNRHSDGAVPLVVLLSVARLGEAQLCGASEDVMAVVLEDLKAGRYRTYLQWRELVVGNRTVQVNACKGFKGDMVLFTDPSPDGDEWLIHELEMPLHAQMSLQIAFGQIDEAIALKIRKIHYQAVLRTADVKDLEHDDLACPICLMEYENDKSDNKERKCRGPSYDVMKDNRQPIELTCGHIFGTTCIEKWLSENDNCPMCRAIIVGKQRKLKPISPRTLSSIRTYDAAEKLLYFEDMNFDQDLHDEVAEAIQTRHMSGFFFLQFQFQRLKEIDLRLGTSKQNSRDHSKTASPVARWMDEDWDRFATNALALRKYVKECIRSRPDYAADPVTLKIKMILAKMLNAHRLRSLL